jgi:hypothetical protein
MVKAQVRLYGIDVRSIFLFRICLGFCLIYNILFYKLPFMGYFSAKSGPFSYSEIADLLLDLVA